MVHVPHQTRLQQAHSSEQENWIRYRVLGRRHCIDHKVVQAVIGVLPQRLALDRWVAQRVIGRIDRQARDVAGQRAYAPRDAVHQLIVLIRQQHLIAIIRLTL